MGSSKDVVLTGVAIGTAPPERIVTRRGANVGDVIATTGPFGLTTLAFKMLIDGLEVSGQLREELLKAAYEPEIHLHLISELAENEAVSASMDSSDGLGITLNTMASQSGLCFAIDRLPSIPEIMDFAQVHGMSILDLIMNGGEEFELVLTIPQNKMEIASRIASVQNIELTSIGRVQEGTDVIWQSNEGEVQILPTGYDNFREWE
jgi:thiamine-monophosphate kinase